MRRTFVVKNGRVVEKEPEVAPDRMQIKCPADIHFASHQLPRNWKHHADSGGEFNAKGQPVFDSSKQVRESVARCRGEEGTNIEYNEL